MTPLDERVRVYYQFLDEMRRPLDSVRDSRPPGLRVPSLLSVSQAVIEGLRDDLRVFQPFMDLLR